MTQPLLRLEHVYKDYGGFKIRDVNLVVNSNEYFIILGPSGAGKSLLLQIIAGIHKPDKGRVLLNDVDVTMTPPEERGIGYVPQNYALFPHMSVYENIEYGLRLRKMPRNVREKLVFEVAEKLNIKHLLNRRPLTLSGGEQQRVALARALVIKPRLLLLDEPLSSIDPPLRWELWTYLREVNREFKVPVLHVTHDFTEAYSLGDRIAVMNNGSIIQVGDPPTIFYKPANKFVAYFTRTHNILEGNAKPLPNGFSEVVVGNKKFIVKGHHTGRVTIVFRPENITLSHNKDLSEKHNVFMGRIVDYAIEGPLTRLIINVDGLKIHAYVFRNTSYNIVYSDKVYVHIKPEHIHVIKE